MPHRAEAMRVGEVRFKGRKDHVRRNEGVTAKVNCSGGEHSGDEKAKAERQDEKPRRVVCGEGHG